jgi:hypothetical protein
MYDYEQIIFMKGMKPIRGVRIPWHVDDPRIGLKALGDIGPPEKVDFR